MALKFVSKVVTSPVGYTSDTVNFITSTDSTSTTLGVDYGFGDSQMAVKMVKPVKGVVTTQVKHSGDAIPSEKEEEEVINPGVFGSGMQIAVEGGRTLNLGNFESARVNVTITVPCDPDTLNEAYEFATGWVSDKLEEAVKAAKGL